jgi:hypothetical protein
MEYQNVIIKIDEKGKVFIEVDGVKGKKCLQITKDIEKLLGTVVKRDLKPEFNDDPDDEDNIITENV